MDVRVGPSRKLRQKNWCYRTVVLEKTLESLLDCKKIQPVHLKGNQSWIFIGSTDAEAETPILWPPNVKNWLTGKDPGAGRDWRKEEKGMTEDEMVERHHRLDRHGFEQAPGAGDEQGRLVCFSPWRHQALNMTEPLNWTELWFSSSHIWMWLLKHKEGKAPKSWCFWTVLLERLLRVP